jgi:hypothetical protein
VTVAAAPETTKPAMRGSKQAGNIKGLTFDRLGAIMMSKSRLEVSNE